jgi:hypothetical protein
MTKQFYQCDVAESESDSLWTGPVVYGTLAEAEFATMLQLQQDWGDGYMPQGFIDDFGHAEDMNDPVFPGEDAWESAGYFDDIDATVGMLPVPPLEALAQLGKISFDLDEDEIAQVLAGTAKARVELDPS